MSKRAIASSSKDPENRSKKACVCGGHGRGARKKRESWLVPLPPETEAAYRQLSQLLHPEKKSK